MRVSQLDRLADAIAERLADRLAKLLERDGTPALLDAKGAARFLGVDRETIYEWARTDRLPAIRLGSGPRSRLRFDPQALVEHLIQADHGE